VNGKQLKDWRSERGYTQQEAAAKIGVGRATIQNWEAVPDEDVPKWAALAVSAVNQRLAPYPGRKG